MPCHRIQDYRIWIYGVTTRGIGTWLIRPPRIKDLINSLKDSLEAAAYLNAAIEEGDRSVFLLALRNVAEAHGGMGVLAEKSHLSRENLYRMLSQQGNPEIKSLYALLQAMGLRLAIEPKDRSIAVFDHQPSQ